MYASVPSEGSTPLIDALTQFDQPPIAPSPSATFFCTPGHRGRCIPPSMQALVGTSVYRTDLPDLPGFHLFDPEGVVGAAQQRAAAVFGAEQTWFLVNGSTVGVMASILATCTPGDKLLLPRTVHRSAIAGLILAGARPIFLQPDYDHQWDLAHCITPQGVAHALHCHPDLKAIFMVSPTYHGVVGNVAAIAQLAHQHHLPLIVDEAHGAHLGFHPDLPPSALSQGADLVVQSTHKTLCALTQAAMLHHQGQRVAAQRVTAALQMLQSSSPSSLLLASLEGVCQQMTDQGFSLMAAAVAIATLARQTLGTLGTVRLLEQQSRPGFWALDPTRLTLDVRGLGQDGFAVDDWCIQQFRVFAELPTLHHLTWIVGMGNTPGDIDRLKAALAALQPEVTTPSRVNPNPLLPDTLTEPMLSPREAFFAPRERVPLMQAAGRICAETLCPYPPGIPLLLPGERCTTEALHYLQSIQDAGGFVTGGEDPTLQQIQVVCQ